MLILKLSNSHNSSYATNTTKIKEQLFTLFKIDEKLFLRTLLLNCPVYPEKETDLDWRLYNVSIQSKLSFRTNMPEHINQMLSNTKYVIYYDGIDEYVVEIINVEE